VYCVEWGEDVFWLSKAGRRLLKQDSLLWLFYSPKTTLDVISNEAKQNEKSSHWRKRFLAIARNDSCGELWNNHFYLQGQENRPASAIADFGRRRPMITIGQSEYYDILCFVDQIRFNLEYSANSRNVLAFTIWKNSIWEFGYSIVTLTYSMSNS